jgi:DNA-binding LytR/AlgR family response regulator
MAGATVPQARSLRALVVDGQTPARSELTRLLGQDPRVGEVRTVATVSEALNVLGARTMDVVFCDVKMPGLAGRDLTRTLARFARRAQVVVATAHEAGSVLTFELRATDCTGNPEVSQCLANAVCRALRGAAEDADLSVLPDSPIPRSLGIARPALASGTARARTLRGRGGDRATALVRTAPDGRGGVVPRGVPNDVPHGVPVGVLDQVPGPADHPHQPFGAADGVAPRDQPGDETIAVELGGVTRFVQRSEVRFVEAHGDYARLHTAVGSHLVRIPLTALEKRWADAGFVRIHRSTLVALPHVDEIRNDGGRCAVRLGDRILQVSRRHTKGLRDRLIRATSLTRDRRGT